MALVALISLSSFVFNADPKGNVAIASIKVLVLVRVTSEQP